MVTEYIHPWFSNPDGLDRVVSFSCFEAMIRAITSFASFFTSELFTREFEKSSSSIIGFLVTLSKIWK